MKKIRSILLIVILGLSIRTFVMEPYFVYSGSMKKTLLPGDLIFTTKYDYGYSKYSFPFNIPIINGKWFSRAPKRGDIIIFRPLQDPLAHYVKRVIGVPGDIVRIKNNIIYINDNPVDRTTDAECYIDDQREHLGCIKQYTESIDDINYNVLDLRGNMKYSAGPYVVPDNKFFVMGDNRAESKDSRFLADVGYIPIDNVVGRARFILISVNLKAKVKNLVRFNRLLKVIR